MGAPGLGSTAVLKWNRFRAPPRGVTRAEAHTHPPGGRASPLHRLWCWRRLLRVPWTARRSNQSILKEINPEYSLKGPVLN